MHHVFWSSAHYMQVITYDAIHVRDIIIINPGLAQASCLEEFVFPIFI